MRKGTKYLDRNGVGITGEHWKKLRHDPNYRVVRRYSNGVVHVELEWLGTCDNPDTFRDYYKLFVLKVNNFNEQGQLVPDPVENGKTFGFEHEAIRAYEQFLERWTESHRDEEGEFVEMDNDLIPPPPPNPDAPSSDVAEIKGMEDDGVGAW